MKEKRMEGEAGGGGLVLVAGEGDASQKQQQVAGVTDDAPVEDINGNPLVPESQLQVSTARYGNEEIVYAVLMSTQKHIQIQHSSTICCIFVAFRCLILGYFLL